MGRCARFGRPVVNGLPCGTLVLVRHGESTANADGTFTGSRDVDLS
ncbi:MAG TPA: histidine phosphatase family protein, partial [Actinotalea sp.]|nr:histidine phosphatase family protein [Actinotalea sp.]